MMAILSLEKIMSNQRKNWSQQEQMLLFNEVNGFCPLCTKSLMYKKENRLEKNINIAHIYPHSPKPEELIILNNVEQLSNNLEDIKNVICLCPECHLKFDKPRTLEEYNKVLHIKKTLLKKRKLQEEFYSYKIEEEIKQILNVLSSDNNSNSNDVKLEYNPKIIDNKTNETIEKLTRQKIKYHVSEFFHIVKREFQNIDAVNSNKATQIAIQIKSFYYKASEINNNQESIYNYLVEWLDKKTNISIEASSIVISYFVQNCEVFDVISE